MLSKCAFWTEFSHGRRIASQNRVKMCKSRDRFFYISIGTWMIKNGIFFNILIYLCFLHFYIYTLRKVHRNKFLSFFVVKKMHVLLYLDTDPLSFISYVYFLHKFKLYAEISVNYQLKKWFYLYSGSLDTSSCISKYEQNNKYVYL